MRRLLDSRAFDRADLGRRFLLSKLHAVRRRGAYRELEVLCVVIGHTKSGGSLVGALLDAHRNIAFADELDALHYVSKGFAIDQVAYLVEKASRREALKGRVTARRLDPYSLAIPGEAQGTTRGLKVIGDSKAGIATQRLGGDVDLLDRIRRVAHPLDVRFIHVVRNPFDPISVMRMRGKRTLAGAVERYFENCRFLDDLRSRIPMTDLHTVRYESIVADPSGELIDLCSFLGVEAPLPYLDACEGLIGEARLEREMVDWTADEIRVVEGQISRHEFLNGYSFDAAGSAP